MNNKDRELLTVAKHFVYCQMASIVMVWSAGFILKFIRIEIYAPLLILMLFAYSFYIFYILFVKENLCPNCGNNFFKQNNQFFNIGFSVYTKKCTNCGYKLTVDKKT